MEKDVITDIDAALAAAANEETKVEESSAEAEAQEAKPSEKVSKGKGAQDRIQELIAEKKVLEAEFSKTKSTLSERDTELGKLVDLLQARENDAEVVKKINELYSVPENKPFIEYLDKLVRGEEVKEKPVLSKTETKELDKATEMLKQLDSKKVEIQDAILEARSDMILEKADNLTDSWVAELPKDYTDKDKEILREALVNRIDWESIEQAEGRNLKNEMKAGFQKTLDWYGTPKGTVETKEKETETPEDSQAKLKEIINKDWGKLREVDRGNGVKAKVPVISDEDFTRSMAEVLKRQNRL